MTENRKLRWYQYSLRTLLVMATLCAVACSWFAVKMRQASRQREAVEAIERLGGWVAYDYLEDESPSPSGQPRPPGPKWLRGLLGEHMFVTVIGVSFLEDKIGPTAMTDAGMEHLKSLPNLKVVEIVNSPELTDAGIAHLSGLAKLEYVDLGFCNITDAALPHLRGLTGLEQLDLVDTGVTEAGVKRLQQALPNCRIQRELRQSVEDPFASDE